MIGRWLTKGGHPSGSKDWDDLLPMAHISEYARLEACSILVDLHDESDVIELIDQATDPATGEVDWHSVAAAVIAVTRAAADALRRPGFRDRP